jgi:hypothetical protein
MKIEKLEVEFYDCVVGWLRLKISAGKQCENLSFSHCFDPLPDLKCWLEAIALGVEQTSFSYNPEGSVIKFDFLETAYSIKDSENDEPPIFYSSHLIDVFSLSFPFYGNDKIFASDNVTLEMIMSNNTIPNEQDRIFFKTWIDRKQLVEVFYNAILDFSKSERYNPEEWDKGYWSGMPLSEFSSEIIETYLNKK